MQLTTLFALLAPIIATAQAKCYRSGENWAPDQVQANYLLGELCDSMYGNFDRKNVKYRCRNAGSANKKLEFCVENTANNALYLNRDDCVLRLSNEINGCGKGGESTIADWKFR